MKKAYLFLALFGIWCLASAIWFMSSIKGFTTAPQAATVGVAIAQVIIMILVSVLLGFAVAWYMREDSLNQKRRDVQALVADRDALLHEFRTYKLRAQKAEYTLARARATFRDDYVHISRERDQLKQTLATLLEEKQALQTELHNTTQRLLEEQQREEMLLTKIEQQKEEVNKQQNENAGVRYFINPFQIAATLESNDIDDLKKIKGIGPLIERKLNMLGIVSFKQISELSKEAIEQIAHTLKFFPDRIQRDQWVQQARECMKNSVRK